ncbi:phage minor capsid protein [Atopobium minutum]|uniref:phage minor capsid protein n=1 Tax=Atopobium minutum TaxID=1381 RepID=UPI002913B81A|nr:phage minor capsid protein [Atopobium minutum]MDU5129713.1 phage minor capsid protein [Atopobium minutum]
MVDKNLDALIEEVVHGALEDYVEKMGSRLTQYLLDGVDNPDMLSTLAARAKSDAMAIFVKYKGRISKETREAFLSAVEGYETEVEQTLEKLHTKHQLTKQGALEFAQAARGIGEIVNRQNIALANTMATTWYTIAANAVVRKELGDSRRAIMEDAVRALSDAGIETIDYKSGVKTTIDAAVRRHIVSQVSQAKAQILNDRCDQYDQDLVFVSAHFGARPSHAIWQGKVYSRSGASDKYPSLDEGTGYSGTGLFGSLGDRLCGVNCQHEMVPYMPGLSQLPDLSFEKEQKRYGMTSEEYYKATQKQRALERKVRKYKRRIALGQEQGLDMVDDRYKLGRTQAMLREHCRSNGLTRLYERERAYGVKKQPRGLGRIDFKSVGAMSSGAVTEAAKVRAEKLFIKAQLAEPAVTEALKSLQTETRKLAGFGQRLKSKTSLTRKIMSSVKEGDVKLNTKTKINDVLRYTFESDINHFVNNFKEVRNALEKMGYTFTRVKNTLKDESAVYRGVNTQVKTPDGYTFEIQFHTPQSLEIKEKNHVLYEQARILDLSKQDDAEKFAQLNKQMEKYSKQVSAPQRIDEIEK